MWSITRLFRQASPQAAPPEPGPAIQRAPRPSGGETILVADDDDVVRNAIRAALKRFGYRVLEASTGVDAILVAAEEEGPIDLILADVIMPSLTTDELESRLHALRPRTPIAFMSGYIHDDSVRRSVVHGPMPFLEKPFSVDQLATTIRSVLDARSN